MSLGEELTDTFEQGNKINLSGFRDICTQNEPG
jgi:hypothetical protein